MLTRQSVYSFLGQASAQVYFYPLVVLLIMVNSKSARAIAQNPPMLYLARGQT